MHSRIAYAPCPPLGTKGWKDRRSDAGRSAGAAIVFGAGVLVQHGQATKSWKDCRSNARRLQPTQRLSFDWCTAVAPPPRAGGRSLISNHSSSLINPLARRALHPSTPPGKARGPGGPRLREPRYNHVERCRSSERSEGFGVISRWRIHGADFANRHWHRSSAQPCRTTVPVVANRRDHFRLLHHLIFPCFAILHHFP